jgi:hypothetical protein
VSNVNKRKGSKGSRKENVTGDTSDEYQHEENGSRCSAKKNIQRRRELVDGSAAENVLNGLTRIVLASEGPGLLYV